MAKGLSLQERKERLIEECSACAMTVGSDGFQGSADASGPSAGFDPLLGKALKKIRKSKKVDESYETLPVERMSSQIKKKGETANKVHKSMKSWQEIDREQLMGGADIGAKREKNRLEKIGVQNKKMNRVLRTHDSLDSRFKELENRDRGEKK